jgi:hypothetical protein
VAALGLLLGGAGFLGGDPAAYAAQGWQLDVAERPVHLGYVLLACLLSGVGEHLPRALDAVSALAAASLVLSASVRARQPVTAAWLAAAWVLPWCAFAEVDLLWMALVAWGAVVASPAMAATLWGLALTVSPVAALALPWAAWHRGGARALAGPLVALAVLSLLFDGAWWTGHRGVLTAHLMPGRSLWAFVVSGAWAVGLLSRDHRLLALAPLVLAPPDVPVWVFVGVVSSRGVPAVAWQRGLAIGAVVLGLWGLGERRARVAREQRVVEHVAAALQPGDVLEAPWSWGARVAVVASGDPYGVHWVAVPRPVRDQARCPAERLVALPVGAAPSTGAVRRDPMGVWWGPGCSPAPDAAPPAG